MKKLYETLTATYEGARLQHEERKIKIGLTRVFLTVNNFVISVPYKDHLIRIQNEFGTSNPATVTMRIDREFIQEFTIESRNHIQNLFSIKKKSFVVKCDNQQYKSIIEEALETAGMNQIAKDNLFEPTIKVENKKGNQFINAEYHLQLKDKIGGVKSLIDFYKTLVDGF